MKIQFPLFTGLLQFTLLQHYTIDLEAIKKVRLEFIAHLDEMHQKREMSDRVHKRIRREQVERLSATLAQIQEQ